MRGGGAKEGSSRATVRDHRSEPLLPRGSVSFAWAAGIDPPRGVLLYGPPGTGKTMMAKAVANHTTAAFIRVVGSEFVQKYLGEGPRMVRDVFRLAKENAPAIIFIDEVGASLLDRWPRSCCPLLPPDSSASC